MFDAAFDELRGALASGRAVMDRLDLASLDAPAARELVVLGERIERLGRCLKLAGIARVTATGAWQQDGDRTAGEWAARTTGTTKKDGERAVETAAQLAGLPGTQSALASGKVSAQQAEAIAGAAAADPGAEERLLGAAGRSSLRDLRRACQDAKAQADPDPEATARKVHAARSCRSWTDSQGVGHLHASGPAATIARIHSAIRHRADRRFRDAHRAGVPEPSEAHGFDALEDLVTGAGDGPPVPRGADAKVIVRIDHAALVRGRAVAGEVCEIAGIGPIPVSTVREWMGDAFVAAILTKGTEITKVVHLGRRFTSEQRTALQWQDPVCAARGCGNGLGLEYDHLDDWARTHTTRSTSAKRFCRACHRRKTLGWIVGPVGADGKHDLSPPPGPRPPVRTDPAATDHELASAVGAAVRARATLFDTG